MIGIGFWVLNWVSNGVDGVKVNTVEQDITRKLIDAFEPSYIEVVNESTQHNVPPNSETHFKVTLVSRQFEGKRPVSRHQKVYALLQQEMLGSVHALALHLYTPEEWQAKGRVQRSPPCLGGNA